MIEVLVIMNGTLKKRALRSDARESVRISISFIRCHVYIPRATTSFIGYRVCISRATTYTWILINQIEPKHATFTQNFLFDI